MRKILLFFILIILLTLNCKGQSTVYTTDSLKRDSLIYLTPIGAAKAIKTFYSEKYLQKIVVKQDSLIRFQKLQIGIVESQNSLLQDSNRAKDKQIRNYKIRSQIRGVENKIWRTAAIASTAILIFKYVLH